LTNINREVTMASNMKKPWLLTAELALLLSWYAPMGICQQAIVLVGSGSTVPAPLVTKWASAYNQRDHNRQMRYLASGTGEGIAAISHGSGDFAAGEVPLTPKQRSEAGLMEVPAIVIGIVPIYNLPSVHAELRFSGEVLADIFLGKITSWNSPGLAKLNPGVSLPDVAIKVVNRPPGKGSNYIFTEFLSKTSARFRSEIGVSASPKWPVGKPAERSSEMVEAVRSEPGAIGYVEAQYAIQSGIPMGLVQNAAGHFVRASQESLTEACRAVEAPGFDKFSASLTNPPGPDSFPIASFDWLYLRAKASDAKRAMALQEFLTWVFSEGQRVAVESGYSELPTALLVKINAQLAAAR
jgi:phosphate transport system substrate-binding protein